MLRIDGPTVSKANLEIITTAVFKTYMQDAGSKDDVLIGLVLDAVHRIVFGMTGSRFMTDLTTASPAEPSHDYLLNGSGTGFIRLPQWPLKSITSLRYGYVDGSSLSADWVTTYTYTSSDYYTNNDTGVIHGIRRGFSPGYNNIRAIWTAGFTTVPEDFKEAIMQFAGVVYKRAKDARWDQLSIGDQSQTTTYARRSMPRRHATSFTVTHR